MKPFVKLRKRHGGIKLNVREICENSRSAYFKISSATAEEKNGAIAKMADSLDENREEIIEMNAIDLKSGEESGLSSALMDRLKLDNGRINSMIKGLEDLISLKDPVGEVVEGWTMKNGLSIRKVRVPIGVIGIIYEARPNVTVDAAGICLKAGNAVVLRGSSSAINSNIALVKAISKALMETTLPASSVQLIENTGRESGIELMRMRGLIDLLIPRGGEGLIGTVVENSIVPVIETGVGNCHTYIDESADIEMAVSISINAKCQRPGVCNAMETLLVHRDIAINFLPLAARELESRGVELKGCPESRKIVDSMKEATEDDWKTEYLDLILAVKIVENTEEAIDHINKYGSHHSETVVTNDYNNAMLFTRMVDSSDVYVNASTRFTDGGEFGLGAEIGISTQKLHARGPMSVRDLTTTKYMIFGNGQIRE